MKILNQEAEIPVMSSCCHAATSLPDHPDHSHSGHGSVSALLSLEIKFFISLIFSLPLLLHMFISWHVLHNDKVQLLLTIPVVIIGIMHFGKSAWKSLMLGVSNMDVLIVMGSGAAFIYSLIGTIFNLGKNYLFYETTASIFTIVLFGNLLEKLSVKKTSSSIIELSKLQKTTAKRLIQSTNKEDYEEIDSSELRIGDLLLINSGDKVPADSEILDGTALLDESMITGESMPVRHDIGERVIGGTLLTDGNLKAKVVKVGAETVLSKIISLVKDAQSKKPDIQRLADKVSLKFVPGVVSISLLTFVISYLIAGDTASAALLRAIAVLVIACPCALGLATPAAVMVGVGKAVQHGLLIREGKTLEKLAEIKTIIFDKTGTLTNGVFNITNITAHNISENELKSLIHSLEERSSHPLAKSITRELKDCGRAPLKKIEEEKGVGLHAIDENGFKVSAGSYEVAKALTDDSSHSIYVVRNGQLVGTVDLEDEVKPESAELIKTLKELGIESVILSGDRLEKCNAIALKVGIEKIYAEKSPKEKLEIVDELQSNGLVAFVGDGINDAPALSKAAVGISLSSASQVAIQSAQVLLMGGRIKQLSEAIEIARKTLKTIKQNLFWAFSYNVIAIPIAAFGFLTPTIAAFAMSFSDVIIILNSLRLKTFKPSK